MDPALGAPFSRYEVNVLVTCEDATCGAPIVEELHPTLGNLIGRIEYMARQGALVTNFRLIKPGAVHRANGGYLLLDARSLLTEALSWTALKRMLKQRRIVIEEPSRIMGLGSTVTLEPDPIPLDVKIVLFGDRLLYYLLSAFDPELREHFKVLADFEDDIDRGEESEAAMARLLAALVKDEELLPIEREGVALLIEHAARMADDAGKLTLLADRLRDLVIEADFKAREAGHPATSRDDIRHTLDERERRASRLRDRSQEAIMKNLALIDTDGARIGQINGLSVLDVEGYRFGKPTRITARVRPGGGRVVDIEREARLGGERLYGRTKLQLHDRRFRSDNVYLRKSHLPHKDRLPRPQPGVTASDTIGRSGSAGAGGRPVASRISCSSSDSFFISAATSASSSLRCSVNSRLASSWHS